MEDGGDFDIFTHNGHHIMQMKKDYIKRKISNDSGTFNISIHKDYIDKVDICPLPYYILYNVEKDNYTNRPLMKFKTPFIKENYIGSVSIGTDNTLPLINLEETQVVDDTNYNTYCILNMGKHRNEDFGEFYDNIRGNHEDAEFFVHEYKVKDYTFKKTNYEYLLIKDYQVIIKMDGDEEASYALKDGDDRNYADYFDDYGIILLRNYGGGASCVVIYIKELDTLSFHGKNIKLARS